MFYKPIQSLIEVTMKKQLTTFHKLCLPAAGELSNSIAGPGLDQAECVFILFCFVARTDDVVQPLYSHKQSRWSDYTNVGLIKSPGFVAFKKLFKNFM